MATPTTYTGEDAIVWLKSGPDGFGSWITHSTLAISDFSVTISRGTAEQELIGSKGNYSLAGARSIEGSLTSCKLTTTGLGILISGMISGYVTQISGNLGANALHFYFKSAMITGFDFSVGTADDITQGSIDYTLLQPYMVSGVQKTGGLTGVGISDWFRW
jgi:hypothetical protein